MSLLEELYGLDEAEEAEALERVIEGGSDDDDERRGDDEAEEADEAEEDRRRVDPTKLKEKRIIKNPRMVLNPARLTGPRGIQVLGTHFKNFKFKGRGHEAEDLDAVLKRLEHWAHRLYPKFQFRDCLRKIETLGTKRPVMVQLRKIRSDQILSDEFVAQKDSSDEESPPAPAPEDEEFDKLLAQQIELARATPGPDSARKVFPQTPARSPALAPKATSSPSISEDQKQRMLRNRQMAEERRLARMRQNVCKSPTENNPIIDNISNENTVNTLTENNSAQVVDLTVFNAAPMLVSLENKNPKETTGPKEIIDMTGDIEVQTTKEVIGVSEIINVNDEDEVGEPIYRNSLHNNKKNKTNVIIDSSDDDIEMNVDSNKVSNKITGNGDKMDTSHDEIGTNGSKELIPLHYSDSSDDECEVTTFNVSVTADVHKKLIPQEKVLKDETISDKDNIVNGSSNKKVLTKKDSISDIDNEREAQDKDSELVNSKDAEPYITESLVRNEKEIHNEKLINSVNENEMDFEINDDEWGTIEDIGRF